MIQITADTRRAVVTNKELLTTGSAGIQVQFTLSEDWAGLAKVAVFRQGDEGEKVDCVLDSDLTCVVPPEVLTTADEVVFIGVYGSNGQGTIIIPTIWASAGVVRPGTEPNTPAAAEPTPEIWAQILSVAQDAEETADAAMSYVEAGLQDLTELEASVEAAESSRVSAEQSRVAAENQRVSTENNRVSAENTRAANENARDSAETERNTAEQSRATAENSRASAESARVSAEQERVAAEQYREEKYAEYVQTVTDAAADARASATAAARSATDAATSASEAADSANQASSSATGAATSSSQASSSAASASTSATAASTSETNAANSATAAAGSASAAATSAQNASNSATAAAGSATAAQTAQGAAEDAQDAAETAAASVSASAAQITKNTSDISELTRQISDTKSAFKALDCEIISVATYTNIGTDKTIWQTSGLPTITEDMYACLFADSGIASDIETPFYINLAYSTGSAVETAISLNKITKIQLDTTREGQKTRFVFRRSNSTLSESIMSSWSYIIVKGTPNKETIDQINKAINVYYKEQENVDAINAADITNTSADYVLLNLANGRIDSHTDPVNIITDPSRVITKDILDFSAVERISISAESGYKFSVLCYSGVTESSFTNEYNWTDSLNILLCRKHIRIFGKKTSGNITPKEFANNIHISIEPVTIQQNLDEISLVNSLTVYDKNSLLYDANINSDGDFVSNNGYTTRLFRAVPGDTITGKVRCAGDKKAFAVYDKNGVLKYSITGVGMNATTNVNYTFGADDCYFVFCSFYTDAAKNIFSAKYKSNRSITFHPATEQVITMTNFNGMFMRGGLNGQSKTWLQSYKYGIVQREAYPIRLNTGDIIFLADNTNVHFRAMYLVDGENTRSISEWISNGTYIAPSPGIYWVEVETTPQVEVTNINDYVSLVRVLKYGDIYDAINNSLISCQKTDWHVKSINHRGMNLFAPENTMPAFELSVKMGWKYIETDIAVTAPDTNNPDGVIVLLHDSTINRTARNADGTNISETINIGDITYEQALTYDFGIWKGTQYARTKIPTLDEFLKFCRKASVFPYLDLGSITDTTLINAVVALVKRNGMENNTTILATNDYALETVAAKSKIVRLGLIDSPSSRSIEKILAIRETKSNEIFIDAQTGTYNTEEIISALIEAEMPLETYAPDSISEVISLDPYVTGVTSDYLVAGKVFYDNVLT